LVRADLNVPLEGARVADDARIRASLPTLQLLLGEGAREVRVCSHLGRPKTEEDRAKYSIEPVRRRLRELLPDDRITVLENTRFNPGEGSRTAATSTSTTHSDRRIALTPRRRPSRTCCRPTPDCCCSPSSSTSGGSWARSSGRS
jgi:3-phosphoglycerate kinase